MFLNSSVMLATSSSLHARWLGATFLFALGGALHAYSPNIFAETTQNILAEILRVRSEETGEKIVLTRRADLRETFATQPGTLYSQLRPVVVWGWTVLHLPGEDISGIEKRAKENELAWAAAIAKYSDRRPMTLNSSHADIGALNSLVWRTCGVKLEYRSLQRSFLSAVAAKGIPAQDFCRDYMLILAANGIVVRQQGERFVAEVEDAGDDDHRRKLELGK